MASPNGAPASGLPDIVIEPNRQQAENAGGAGFSLFFQIAGAADDLPVWGRAPRSRDQALRAFWPTEPTLAGGIFSLAARYSAFGFTLDGPPRTVRIFQDVLQGVERGEGWNALWMKVLNDYWTQDNGAFILVLRAEDRPNSPMVSLRHLESNRCIRTGRHEEPVVYIDRAGNRHLLKWYQVICLCEMPSPVELMNGMGLCAVSRILRAAQIMRDISIYTREKVSGRDARAVHFVSGISHKAIQEHFRLQQAAADTRGVLRYIDPAIIGSIDPTANVSSTTIELASLPDSFDLDEQQRWYINQLALTFGSDYQDFAPLPGGNLGSGQQSGVLHMKSQGKGARLFMSTVEHFMNFRGILPDTLHFGYGDQDPAADRDKAELALLDAKTIQIYVSAGVLSLEVARQIMADKGYLSREYLHVMGGSDPTPHAIVSSGDDPPEGPNAYDNITVEPQTYASPALTAAKAQVANEKLGMQQQALAETTAAQTPATSRMIPNGPKGVSSDNPTKKLTNAPRALPRKAGS